MPITADGELDQYEIPEKYKALLTREFLVKFAESLLMFFPNANTSYMWFWLESTSGWVEAFTRTAKTYEPHDKYQELLDYYSSLEWYDFDMFNDEVLDLAVEFGVVSCADTYDEI